MDIIWLLKQVLPFKYETVYTNSDNQKIFCSWRMWFGKSFEVKHYIKKE